MNLNLLVYMFFPLFVGETAKALQTIFIFIIIAGFEKMTFRSRVNTDDWKPKSVTIGAIKVRADRVIDMVGYFLCSG